MRQMIFKRMTVGLRAAMMLAVVMMWPTGTLCQTKVTAGKDVKAIGVKAATDGAQESVTQIGEEGQEVPAAEGSTVRVIGNDPEAGKAARLKISKIPGSEVVNVQSIMINGPRAIRGGETVEFTAEISPENASSQDVTWSAEDCDAYGKSLGTQNNTIIVYGSNSFRLTGFRTGSVMVTASATDGSSVKGSMIVEVLDNAPAETSGIGGGESAASFGPAIPIESSLIELRTIPKAFRKLKSKNMSSIYENLPEGVKKDVSTNMRIIDSRAYRLTNYRVGDFEFDLPVTNWGTYKFLILYVSEEKKMEGYVLNATLTSDSKYQMIIPQAIAKAINGKDFLGIILSQLDI